METHNPRFLTLLLVFFSAQLFAQPGSLDLPFGTNGIVNLPVSTADNDRINDIAIQQDGKIVAVGYSHNVIDSTSTRRIAITRHEKNGTLDSTFGQNGVIIIRWDSLINTTGNEWSEAHTVAIQEDGMIIVGGEFNSTFTLLRFMSNGMLDNTFGSNGVVITPIEESSSIKDIVILSNGEILATGSTIKSRKGKIALAKYHKNGALNPLFGTGGVVITEIKDVYQTANAIALQPESKIIVVGYINDETTDMSNFLTLRYNEDGSLDNQFGDNGAVIHPISDTEDQAKSVIIQKDNKIVVAGYAYGTNSSNPHHAVVRYLPNGQIDNTFATDGLANTKVGSSYDQALSVTLQTDNKILVAGDATGGVGVNGGILSLLRYNTDGSLDESFGDMGLAKAGMDGLDFNGQSVLVQNDNKILVGGYVNDTTKHFNFLLVRFLSGLEVGIINFAEQKPQMMVYPNPVKQNTTLSYELKAPETINIDLIDFQGKTVANLLQSSRQGKGKHQTNLNIPTDLAPGKYILTVSSAKGKIGIHVIIE